MINWNNNKQFRKSSKIQDRKLIGIKITVLKTTEF